ncbi:hypothetical protein EH223_19100 [candidate division KSB1 bacterium]|nr:hypothetical protein [candidate division KSB1 bacterium]RQW00304.1 MAG: hypothetical protein EH223_19100 [candidate division KSB1 bacterium]
MRIKIFFLCSLFLLTAACEKDENLSKQPHDVTRPRQSDRKPNGGLLRFTLGDKPLHDSFFEAQFTPRGEVFELDNLQLYNYNLDSDKYPQVLINVNHKESDVSRWVNQSLPIEILAFTAAPNTPALKSSNGTIKITKVTNRNIEGTFSGELFNPKASKTFAIRGEFRAVLRINI